MEIKNIFTDRKAGGNNYILKADSENRWCGFNKNVIDDLKGKFNDSFNIVLWGTKSESDYYCIPFQVLAHLFTSEHMTKGKIADQGNLRWTAIIDDHVFKMHANSTYSANIQRFYGKTTPEQVRGYEDTDKVFDIDYTIEDAKANVKIRLGQSTFRSAVLDNFEGRCCISGIKEAGVLIASHIVPWSANKNYRSDPSNGLCLFVEYDAYFDKGYITIDEELRVIVSNRLDQLSIKLKERLEKLRGLTIARPSNFTIKKEYIHFHNREVFDKF